VQFYLWTLWTEKSHKSQANCGSENDIIKELSKKEKLQLVSSFDERTQLAIHTVLIFVCIIWILKFFFGFSVDKNSPVNSAIGAGLWIYWKG